MPAKKKTGAEIKAEMEAKRKVTAPTTQTNKEGSYTNQPSASFTERVAASPLGTGVQLLGKGLKRKWSSLITK